MNPGFSPGPQHPKILGGIYEGPLRTAIARVLGIPKLRPLTMGHVALLETMHSPFLPGWARDDIRLGEFATCVWVCSIPWRDAVRRYLGAWTRIRIAMIAGWYRSDFATYLPQLKAHLTRELAVPNLRLAGDLHSPARLNWKDLVRGLCPLLQKSEDSLLGMEVSQITSAACRVAASRGWATETPFPFASDSLEFLGHFVATAARTGPALNE